MDAVFYPGKITKYRQCPNLKRRAMEGKMLPFLMSGNLRHTKSNTFPGPDLIPLPELSDRLDELSKAKRVMLTWDLADSDHLTFLVLDDQVVVQQFGNIHGLGKRNIFDKLVLFWILLSCLFSFWSSIFEIHNPVDLINKRTLGTGQGF